MTGKDTFLRMEALFHELEALDESGRGQKLRELATQEPALYASLIPLLQQTRVEGAERAMDQISEAASDLAGHSDLPEWIDRYRLIRSLGEGGMGYVFMAEQYEPVRRTVALKITRRGLDQREMDARFRAERQALAVLEHPNIARVYDAGNLDDGRPWFAMELIEGVTITEWAAQANLDLQQRVRLMITVCEAVQHAHRKGLIHRDLKPSNIMVMDDGGMGQAKVIDFGIAKVTELSMDSRSFHTSFGDLVGTPEYMSPEQASLGEVDVDTRSDVYALGLVLYELLAGSQPLDSISLRQLGFQAMCRQIREGETPRPSSVAHGIGDQGTATWRHRLRGDLDCVVLKALAKDREQRYGSAAALAEDLERYLQGEPILAQPPSVGYRVGKFVTRHRLPVFAGLAIACALVVGSVLAGIGLLESRKAEARALLAAERADAARRTAESATAFMVDLFQGADPRSNPGLDLTARELLERGAERVESLRSEPLVQADLFTTLGEVYRILGDLGQAEALLMRGLDLRSEGTAADLEKRAMLKSSLAAVMRERHDYEQADALSRQALTLLAESGHMDGLNEAALLNELGMVLSRQRRLDESEAAYTRALHLMEQHRPASAEGDLDWARRTATLLGNLATIHSARDRPAAAAVATRQALALLESYLPRNDPRLAIWHNNLGIYAATQGRLGEALRHGRLAVDINEQALPEDHPVAALHRLNLAGYMVRLGLVDQATPHLHRVHELMSERYGASSMDAARPLGWLGLAALAGGDVDAAQERIEQVLAILRASTHPASNRFLGTWLRRQADIELRRGDTAAARTHWEEALSRADERDRDRRLALLGMGLMDRLADDVASAAERRSQAGCDIQISCAELGSEALVLLARWRLHRGERDGALSALSQALAQADWSAALLNMPVLDPLSTDPGMQQLRQQLSERIQQALQEAELVP